MRPLVMGVVNVTPDSFSDGGKFLDPQTAIAHARRLAGEGTDILDIGAESTRPYGGTVRVPLEEERARLAPVLAEVIALGVPVSVDTLKAAVAAWALDLGAAIVNDVWGLQRDPDMARVVAERGVPVIIMHNRETADPTIDIVADVTAFFQRSLDIAARAGIARERIVLDPGIGFGKTAEQSLICIARLDAWRSFGLPLLVGASRKRFIHSFAPSDPMDRLGGSLAAHLLAVENGAAIVRVHDVAPTVQALTVAAAIRRAR
ncbi:MAG: dihydropteroate synthase [Xanthobacteraceae bacterium]